MKDQICLSLRIRELHRSLNDMSWLETRMHDQEAQIQIHSHEVDNRSLHRGKPLPPKMPENERQARDNEPGLHTSASEKWMKYTVSNLNTVYVFPFGGVRIKPYFSLDHVSRQSMHR